MDNAALLQTLKDVVGRRHVLTRPKATERFRRGFRSGEGEALCVVRPGSLLHMWQVLRACVAADKVVIMQAANTGLTEGSTPRDAYDRDVVLINTRRLDAIHLLSGGEQVLGFAGATLFDLERQLAPLGREPHSVIGSTSIGASIVGGVCNNSGGSLVERGPSYTEMALFAQIDADGGLHLVNHLGIELGDTPEDILTRLDRGAFDADSLAPANRRCRDTGYADAVRDVDADTPARFNGDKRRLFEASGCAGKLGVFAVRLDTFKTPARQQSFYVGTNNVADLTDLRRAILLNFATLPVSAEYMERDAFDIAARYGKDTVLMIDWFGTSALPMFFALKGAIDAHMRRLPLFANLTDRALQLLARMTPAVLPPRMREYRARYRHHLLLKMRDEGIDEARELLSTFFRGRDGDVFACTPREGKIAALHRYAAAGAAVRYMALHQSRVEAVIPLDIALKRNDRNWSEVLPPEIDGQLVHKLYYGHFMCHVLHQDYVVKKGTDAKKLKTDMLRLLDQRGAEYPAEHNVGHLYVAKPDLAEHYRRCDPTNSFNPGIGRMSKARNYAVPPD